MTLMDRFRAFRPSGWTLRERRSTNKNSRGRKIMERLLGALFASREGRLKRPCLLPHLANQSCNGTRKLYKKVLGWLTASWRDCSHHAPASRQIDCRMDHDPGV